MSITQSVLEGNRLATARVLTWVENNTQTGRQVLSELYPSSGQAHLIGITGAPGTGKSSLVNQIALFLRRNKLKSRKKGSTVTPTVAIIAVDPSSPFTGGSILGDRVRMRDLAGDPGIFIRSMASRGSLGGLARATSSAALVLDAAGYNIILIETVGTGQAEVDIAKLAHTTVVVESPGLGDDIQAIKAGILEIADILVVNKADLAGVEATESALRGMLQLGYPTVRGTQFHHGKIYDQMNSAGLQSGDDCSNSPTRSQEPHEWIPPIRRTVATDGEGVPDLIEIILKHREFLLKSGLWQDREHDRLESELNILLHETLVHEWRERVPKEQYVNVLNDLFERKISPSQAVEILIN
jgi:LAO/AO transport system kinase